MKIPLKDIERIGDIAKDRYMGMKRSEAFPFTYVVRELAEDLSGESPCLVYKELRVDYSHDIGVFIEVNNHDSN